VGFLGGLVLTLAVWFLYGQAERLRLRELQESHVAAISGRIEGRMASLARGLQASAGYLGRGPLPTRSEWRAYVQALNLPGTNAGVQGTGFAEWLPPGRQADHVRRVRGEGFPDYDVVPGGGLPDDGTGTSAILYLEPPDARNLRAFGRDMLREAVRREALARARDQGLPALSGPVTLYQETGTEVQKGCLLFAPVYQEGLSQQTVAERRAALRAEVQTRHDKNPRSHMGFRGFSYSATVNAYSAGTPMRSRARA
jgi:CHASE1-domain containing sensor protein